MNQQIGARTISACLLLETHGPMDYRRMADFLGLVHKTNAYPMMDRAVHYGLMTADRTASPVVFSVVDNWRELVEKKVTKPLKEKKKPEPKKYKIINSVFQLANA